jgi:hypothetical protein
VPGVSAPKLLPHRGWPELLMHVLAHVRGTQALASSVYDARYVAWAEQELGPAGERALGEDAAALALALPDHESLSRVQLLAWLFDDVEQAQSSATRDLVALTSADVTRAALLEPLGELGAAAEVLRCAALLEAEFHGLLMPPFVGSDLVDRLIELSAASPRLAASEIMSLRALRLRGRVHGSEIWVGAPGDDLDVDVEHVGWQAAHEATVAELSARSSEGCGKRDAEHAAVVLLAERASAAGLAERHARWLAHFGDNAPTTERASLAATARALL